MSNVHVVEKKSGRVVATVPNVVVRGQNYTPTIREVEDLAWKCAVSDRSVDPMRRDDYSFRVEAATLPPPAPESWSS
jgi:hypothetical protein